MPKLPQFLAKLSSKQIYEIFAFATALFVIISFVVAQNVQYYGKNSNSQANSSSNSSSNSATNSLNDSKKSSQNSNSTSSESQNPYFINNSANSQPENSQPENSKSLNSENNNSKNSGQKLNQNNNLSSPGATEKWYFKGSVDKKPIRMMLNYSCTYMPICHEQVITGNYIYENVSQSQLFLKCNLASDNKFTCQEEEIKDEMRPGNQGFVQDIVKITGNFEGIFEDKTITGTWSNPDKTVKLPFSLEKVEEFKLDDFLKKEAANSANFNYQAAELEKYNPCPDYGKKAEINQEIISKKFQTKFLVLGQLCGIYYMPSNLVSVKSDGKLEKIYEGRGGFIQEISFSPNEDFILIRDGAHSGACYHTFGFSILNIAQNKIVFTNLDKGKIDYQTTEEIKWINQKTFKYAETIYLEGACASAKDGSINTADPKLVQKNEKTVNLE